MDDLNLDDLPEIGENAVPGSDEINLDDLPEMGGNAAPAPATEAPAPATEIPAPAPQAPALALGGDTGEVVQMSSKKPGPQAISATAGKEGKAGQVAPNLFMNGDTLFDSENRTVKPGQFVTLSRKDGTSQLLSFEGASEDGKPVFKEVKGVATAGADLAGEINIDEDDYNRMFDAGNAKVDRPFWEQVRNDALANTGDAYRYTDDARGTFNAFYDYLMPFLGGSAKKEHEERTRILSDIREGRLDGYDGDTDAAKLRDAARKAKLEPWNPLESLHPGESDEDFAQRIRQEAEDELKLGAAAKGRAEQARQQTEATVGDKILKGGVESGAFALQFAIPGSIMFKGLSSMGMGAKAIRALTTLGSAIPATIAEADKRYSENITPEYGWKQTSLDGEPEFGMVAAPDAPGEAAYKAIGGAVFDTAVEVGLESATMGLLRLAGKPAGWLLGKATPGAVKEWGAKKFNRFMASETGQALRQINRAYQDFAGMTQINSPFGELAEENVQALEKVLNLDGKTSEYKGLQKEWNEFYDRQFNADTQWDIFYGLIAQLGLGAAKSTAEGVARHVSEADVRRDVRMALARSGISEATMKTLTPEQQKKLDDMWRQYSADPDALKENVKDLGISMRLAVDELTAREGLKMRQSLEQRGIAPERFTIQTGADGKPAFQKMTRFTPDGKKAPMNAMTDAAHGVTIVDQGDGNFYVMNDFRGLDAIPASSFEDAQRKADAEVVRNQSMDADNEQKAQYLMGLVQRQYAGRNVVSIPSEAALRWQVAQAVRDGRPLYGITRADQLFREDGSLRQPGAGGFHTPDGHIVVILDNVPSPAEMERVLAHEATGHEGVESATGHGAKTVEFIQNAQAEGFSRFVEGERQRRIAANMEAGMDEESAVAEAEAHMATDDYKRESMARYAQGRLHAPTWYERRKHEANQRRRAAGENVPTDQADLEVMLAEQEAQGRAGDNELETLNADSGVRYEEGAEDEAGNGADEAPAQPEQGEERGQEAPRPEAGAELGAQAPDAGVVKPISVKKMRAMKYENVIALPDSWQKYSELQSRLMRTRDKGGVSVESPAGKQIKSELGRMDADGWGELYKAKMSWAGADRKSRGEQPPDTLEAFKEWKAAKKGETSGNGSSADVVEPKSKAKTKRGDNLRGYSYEDYAAHPDDGGTGDQMGAELLRFARDNGGLLKIPPKGTADPLSDWIAGFMDGNARKNRRGDFIALFGMKPRTGTNDALAENMPPDLQAYVGNMIERNGPGAVADWFLETRRKYREWAQGKRDAAREERMAAKDRAEEGEALESFDFDELASARDAMDEEFANALGVVEGADEADYAALTPANLQIAKSGDTIRFDHDRKSFAFGSFDAGSGVLVVYDEDVAGMEGGKFRRAYRVTENSIEEIDDGQGNEVRADADRAGDEKGPAGGGGEAQGGGFRLESATAEQITAEEKKRREKAEIKKRQEAPLKGSGAVNVQPEMDLGQTGQQDLFSPIAEKPKTAPASAPKKTGTTVAKPAESRKSAAGAKPAVWPEGWDNAGEEIKGYIAPQDGDIRPRREVAIAHRSGGSINAPQKIKGVVESVDGDNVKVYYKDGLGYDQHDTFKKSEIVGVMPSSASVPATPPAKPAFKRGDRVFIKGAKDGQRVTFLKANADGTADVQVRTPGANRYAPEKVETRTVPMGEISSTGMKDTLTDAERKRLAEGMKAEAVWRDSSGREREWPGFVSPEAVSPKEGLVAAVRGENGGVLVGRIAKLDGENVEIVPYGAEDEAAARTFPRATIFGVRDPAAVRDFMRSDLALRRIDAAYRAAKTDAERNALKAQFAERVRALQGGVNFDTPELTPEGRRQYDEVVARYTNPDGTKKRGWMRAPNGQPTQLTERQWVQVRTPAFKKWFGDWENAARRLLMDAAKVARVTQGAFKKADGTSIQQTASAMLKKPVVHETEIGDITIDRRSAHDSLAHRYSQKKLDALVTIQQDFANAVYLGSERDFDGKDIVNHYFAYPIAYGEDGERNLVFCRAREDKNANRLYVHEVFLESELKDNGDALQAAAASSTKDASRTDASPSATLRGIAQARIILNRLFAVNGVSRVVDENGEPMVVWHGTLAKGLTRFDSDLVGSRYSYDEKGFFFIDRKSLAQDYATSEFDSSRKGEVIPALLSLKDPLIVNRAWCAKNGLGNRVFDEMDAIEFWDSYQSLMLEESDGRDGVIIDDGTSKMCVAFSPTQIKSATNNNGDFDGANDVIRFDTPELDPGRRAEEVNTYAKRYVARHKALRALNNPKPEGVMDVAEGRWQKFRRAIQDKNLVIREVEERLGVTDKKRSVYYAKDREFGLNEHQLGELQRRHVDPIFEALAQTGASQEAFDLYLIARHAPYRNALVKGRNGTENGSGMSDEDAEKVIENVRRLGLEDDFARIAEMVYAMNDEALQRLVDSGRMAQDVADGFRAAQADYVPLRTDMEDADRDAFNSSTSGWKKNEFHAAKGRNTLADSPLAWSIVQAERAIKASNANVTRQVAAALVRHAEKIGKPIGEIIPARRVQKRWALDIGDEVLTVDELQDKPEIIFFKEDGKLKAIRIDAGKNALGVTFAKAVTDKDLVQFSKWFEWVPKLTRAMSAMRTQYVPTFILRNLKADTLEALLNVSSERGLFKGASFGKRLLANEWKNLKDVKDYFKIGEARGWVKEFVENGGLTGGGMAAEGFSDAAKRIQNTLKAARGGKARNLAAAIPDAISLLNACAEYGTRIGIYSTLRQEGMSIEDAISYARDATVNFNRKGYLTPYTNAAFMFSNAAIQGMGRAFKSIGAEHGKQVIAAIFMVGVIQGLLDWWLGDDDDREKKGLSNARNLSEHEKQSSIGIPLPGGTRLKTQVRNPWALPMYAGRKTVELVVGWASPKDAAKDMASAIGGFIAEPVGGNGFDSISQTWQTFAPTLADPLVQWMTGKDFKGDDRLKFKFDENMPDAWNGKRNTASPYKWIAQTLNWISGGNEFRKGAFDTSPENWQLLAETVLGGALTDMNRVTSTVSDAWDALHGAKPDQVARDIPFVRDTITNMPDISRRYFDKRREYDADKTEYRGAKTVEEQMEYVASRPWVVDERAKELDKEITELGKREQGLEKEDGKWVSVERKPAEALALRRWRLEKMAEFVRIMEQKPSGKVPDAAAYGIEVKAFEKANGEFKKTMKNKSIPRAERDKRLSGIRDANPLMRNDVRGKLLALKEDIAKLESNEKTLRENGASKKRTDEVSASIAKKKAEFLDEVRKARGGASAEK